MSESKSRLARWSERKHAARRGEAVDEPVAPTPPVDAVPAGQPTSMAPTEEAETPVLPSIDELDFQSDYTAFLRENVPEALRRAALRKLWLSDPVLANLDGLNDYDENYNLVDQAITLLQTRYRPGRGYADETEDKADQIVADGADAGAGSPPQAVQVEPADEAAPSEADDDAPSENVAAVNEVDAAAQQNLTIGDEIASAELVQRPNKKN